MEEKRTPGVIIYHEYLEPFQEMDANDVKNIIIAALQYGRGESVDEPQNGNAKFLWSIMKRQLKTNKERYDQTCENRAYGRYCQIKKDKGEEPLSREEWDERRK